MRVADPRRKCGRCCLSFSRVSVDGAFGALAGCARTLSNSTLLAIYSAVQTSSEQNLIFYRHCLSTAQQLSARFPPRQTCRLGVPLLLSCSVFICQQWHVPGLSGLFSPHVAWHPAADIRLNLAPMVSSVPLCPTASLYSCFACYCGEGRVVGAPPFATDQK